MRYWYIELFRELSKRDIKFVVAGGIALNLLGVPRFTADLDLILALDQKNIQKFIKCMTKLNYSPKAPVKAADFANDKNRDMWFKEKNMRVFCFMRLNRPYEIVDVFIKEPVPFAELWKERENIRLENTKIPVISIRHLIKLKKNASRLQDLSDVDALKKLIKELADEKKGKAKKGG